MKQKILEQAMRGELVEQNPNDEPVEVLLERIEEEKKRLVKEKPKPLPQIEDDEIPYELPEGWKWVRLRDIVDLLNGRAYKKHELLNKDEGRTPVLRVGNFFTNNSWYYSDLDLQDDKYCDNGDLLYAWSASFGPKIWNGGKVIYHYHIWKVNIFGGVSKQFLYYLFLKDVNDIKDVTTGSTMVHVTKANMEKRVFPLPPLNEQKYIVEKIESLFDLCEKWEQEVSKQQVYLSTLREKVLDDAMKGVLVERDPNDEPAEVLLKQIEEEKQELIKEKKIKKQKPLPPIEEDEIPFELPNGWKWVRIRDITLVNPRNQIDDELDVGFVPMKMINEGYSTDHTFEIKKWKEVKKGFTHFKEQDILVSKITPCFENKKSVIVKNLPNDTGAGTTELHVLRPFHEYIMKEYLMVLFKSNTFIEKGVQTFTGTAGQQRISKEFLENYIIGLPPLNEQKRIVEKIEKIYKYIHEFESRILLPK
ncbi:restriction endonuclease subunit S [Amphibacillus sp. Q70]|uniref:restriction endonuclease subunit S n=1 Tax=Amphibacillus sp. Q70 TaxID=3453416 RepID=UPI003F83590F